jgi:hypothetical protein
VALNLFAIICVDGVEEVKAFSVQFDAQQDPTPPFREVEFKSHVSIPVKRPSPHTIRYTGSVGEKK